MNKEKMNNNIKRYLLVYAFLKNNNNKIKKLNFPLKKT